MKSVSNLYNLFCFFKLCWLDCVAALAPELVNSERLLFLGILHVSIVPLSVWTTKRLSKVCNHVILIHRPDAEKYFELGHATFYYWTLGQAGRVAHVYRG